MGLVVETILAAEESLTGGGFETLDPGTNDTFTVRDFEPGSKAYIEGLWGLDTAHKALFSIASPRMNDNTLGLQLALPSGAAVGPAEEPQDLFPGASVIPVYESDTMRVRVSGTAGDAALFAFTIRYENLAGSDVGLATWDMIRGQITKTFGILVTPTNGVADYGSPVTLDSSDDRLEADRRYALLGATTDTPTGLISIEGPDTGRYRIGMPGKVDPVEGADYFIRQSTITGRPCIPILKSNNKGSTLISTADAAAGASPNITLVLAQLAT